MKIIVYNNFPIFRLYLGSGFRIRRARLRRTSLKVMSDRCQPRRPASTTMSLPPQPQPAERGSPVRHHRPRGPNTARQETRHRPPSMSVDFLPVAADHRSLVHPRRLATAAQSVRHPPAANDITWYTRGATSPLMSVDFLARSSRTPHTHRTAAGPEFAFAAPVGLGHHTCITSCTELELYQPAFVSLGHRRFTHEHCFLFTFSICNIWLCDWCNIWLCDWLIDLYNKFHALYFVVWFNAYSYMKW